MKKLLFAAIVLFIVNGTFAQDIIGGIKVGANLSTLTGTVPLVGGAMQNKQMKVGFHIGGFVDFAFNERLSLQPELLFSIQGAKEGTRKFLWRDDDNNEYVESVSGSITLNYINVPVLLKINLAEGLSAEIGPQIGFLLSAEMSVKVDGNMISTNATATFNTLDVTAIAGLSYTFAENFVVSARYGLGLTKVYKNSECFSKNNVIQLSVGYKF